MWKSARGNRPRQRHVQERASKLAGLVCDTEVFLTPTLTPARSADETRARSSERQPHSFRLPPRDQRRQQRRQQQPPPAAAFRRPHTPGAAPNRASPLTRGQQEGQAPPPRPPRAVLRGPPPRPPAGGRAHNRGSTAAEPAAAATA